MDLKAIYLRLIIFISFSLLCYPICADGRDIPWNLRSFYHKVKVFSSIERREGFADCLDSEVKL